MEGKCNEKDKMTKKVNIIIFFAIITQQIAINQ